MTPANVNARQFGKLFTRTMDSDVNGQVLYLPQVMIGGARHNVIYAYTSNNNNGSPSSVYAFDADDPYASAPLWRHVLPSAGEWMTCAPVIDPDSGIIYVLQKVNDNNGPTQLHALDIATGEEKPNSPVTIAASVPGAGDASVNGVLSFDTRQANCRPALLLVNGTVYMAFALGYDTYPFHGWIFGYQYSPAGFIQTAKFCTTPNGGAGGIWMSGKGLTADADGYIYCTVGNGTFDADTGGQDYGMCVLKLRASDLSVVDWFAPFDELAQGNQDLDLCNTGVTLIPGTNRLFTGATKFGSAFVLDTNNLGRFTANGPDASVQRMDGLTPIDSVGQNPICWNADNAEYVYLWAKRAKLEQFNYDAATSQMNPRGVFKQSEAAGTSGASLAISANGNADGILWAVGYDHVVHAFDAADVTRTELWNSSQNAGRDFLPSVGHFQFPTVVNGKVYVGTSNHTIVAYGLLPTPKSAKVHLLWNTTDGRMSVWTGSVQRSSFTHQDFGPFPGWTAIGIADCPDGNAGVLWTHTNGQASLWRVAPSSHHINQEYGPFSGWTARSLSAGSDNSLHVLWNYTDGTASLWRVSPDNSVINREYGPFSGWTALALADGPDNQTRMLWSHGDGTAALWTLDDAGNVVDWDYGPITNSNAAMVAVGPDNQARIAWNFTDASISLWSVDSSAAYTNPIYGPYSGQSLRSIAVGSDGLPILLWDNADGSAGLWSLTDTGIFADFIYGPYPGWTAAGVSASR